MLEDEARSPCHLSTRVPSNRKEHVARQWPFNSLRLNQLDSFLAGSFDHDGPHISKLVRLLEKFNAFAPQFSHPRVEIHDAQGKMIHEMAACAHQRAIARIHV